MSLLITVSTDLQSILLIPTSFQRSPRCQCMQPYLEPNLVLSALHQSVRCTMQHHMQRDATPRPTSQQPHQAVQFLQSSHAHLASYVPLPTDTNALANSLPIEMLRLKICLLQPHMQSSTRIENDPGHFLMLKSRGASYVEASRVLGRHGNLFGSWAVSGED